MGLWAEMQGPHLVNGAKLFHTQTSSQINNTDHQRNTFMTFVCELISSEQMIFLCLFKKQVVSHDRCIHHPNNRAAFRPLLCPTASEHSRQPSTSRAPRGAQGQGSDSGNRLPHSWTCYSQPLPPKSRQNEQLKKKMVGNIPFSMSYISRPE